MQAKLAHLINTALDAFARRCEERGFGKMAQGFEPFGPTGATAGTGPKPSQMQTVKPSPINVPALGKAQTMQAAKKIQVPNRAPKVTGASGGGPATQTFSDKPGMFRG